MTGSDGQGSVKPDLYIVRVGRRPPVAGVSVYLPLCICKVRTRFLVDTGAEVIIMSQRFFERIPEEVRPKMVDIGCKMKLEVADKGLVDVIGAADIKFETGHQRYIWHVLISPIEEDGLLGMDFLFAQNFELSTWGLKLNGQPVATDIEGISLDNVRVSVREDTVIPPNSQLLVSAKLNVTSLKHTTALIEPIPGKEVDEGLIIGKSLVDLTRRSTYLPVRLMNVSAESLLLHKDTVVGQLSEVDSISLLFESENNTSPPIPDKIKKVHTVAVNKHKGGKSWRDGPDPVIGEWPAPLQDLYHKNIEDLSVEERKQLAKLIGHNKHAFAMSQTDLSQTSVVKHSISTGFAKPIKQQPRRTPKALEEEEEKILKEQLEASIIQDSTSPWASPIVYVRKKDGTLRPCVDCRRVNEVTEKDAYPLPVTSDCLDCLNGARYMSSLDL